jgi:hypothetical protein
MATKVVINDNDEYAIPKSMEGELRRWLEENADIIVENVNEQDLDDDEMVIDFQPTSGSVELRDAKDDEDGTEEGQ